MYVEVSDLTPWADIDPAKAEAMISDAEAMALLAAPCLAEPAALTVGQSAAVKALLRRAILRWHEVGTGAVTQQTSGPFGQSMDTTKSSPRGLFWPSEISDLQAVCKSIPGAATSGKAFTIDTAPSAPAGLHADICNLAFGAGWCSCGSSINAGRGPLWEIGGETA